jgi:hypothetical protein
MREIDEETLYAATSATLDQLLPSSSSSDPNEQCEAFTKSLFPDEVDTLRFNSIYTSDLYDRSRLTVDAVRIGVESVLKNDTRIRTVLVDPDSVADDVSNVRIRIPGSPRGSWAGAKRPQPSAEFSSADSIFVMALKQARVVFKDRHRMVATETDECEAPPVMDSLTANAYIYPGIQCSYYLLGLSVRPFLGDSLSDDSIASRFGYIVAHEMSHCTLNSAWNTGLMASLLHRYDSSTYSEAIADVVGGLGVLEAGFGITSSNLCSHVAQTWCARTGALYHTGAGGVHPKANRRGDAFCDTLIADLGS